LKIIDIDDSTVSNTTLNWPVLDKTFIGSTGPKSLITELGALDRRGGRVMDVSMWMRQIF
jgi:hypothetical protein